MPNLLLTIEIGHCHTHVLDFVLLEPIGAGNHVTGRLDQSEQVTRIPRHIVINEHDNFRLPIQCFP
jgi:hypothetical protein